VRRAVAPPAPVLVLGAVASVQSGAAVATKLFPDVGPTGTLLLRLGLSAALLVVIARPRWSGRQRPDVVLVVAYAVALAAMNGTFYEALDRIPLGVAVTVEFVGPLAVAVAGSRRWLDVAWVGLAALGVVLLTSGGGGRNGIDLAGVAWAATAGVFWAAYILLTQRLGRAFPGATGLAIGLTIGTVCVLPFGIAAGGTKLLRPDVLGRGAAVALLSSAVPYSLELFALRRMRASVFSVLMSLEPAMAALSGLLFLGQHLELREWIAVGCVMTASIGATRGASDVMPVEPGATPVQASAG
jgi:inner membrane transporter RhtA